MTSKKYWKVYIFILTVITILFITLFTDITHQAFTPSNGPKPISLKESYLLGLPTAKEWNENAELYLITSIEETDLEKEKNYTAGLDGKRRFWNMIFAVPGTSKSIIITIHDKEIVNKLEAMNEFSSRELVYMDDIHFDSTELVKKIEGSNSIVPGNTWIRGYHFNLSRSGDKTVLGIVGLNPNDDIKLSRISFDVKRGTLIN